MTSIEMEGNAVSDKRPISEGPSSIMDSGGIKKKGKSIIWDYFELASSDEGKATCVLCGSQLKRKHGNTTNMWTHLKARHPGTHTEADHKRKQVKKVIAFNFFSLFRVSLKLFKVCVMSLTTRSPRHSSHQSHPCCTQSCHRQTQSNTSLTRLCWSSPLWIFTLSTLFLVRDSKR